MASKSLIPEDIKLCQNQFASHSNQSPDHPGVLHVYNTCVLTVFLL